MSVLAFSKMHTNIYYTIHKHISINIFTCMHTYVHLGHTHIDMYIYTELDVYA